jgi:hypothetical protein
MNSSKLTILVILAALGSMMLSACGAGKPAPTPTLGIPAIQTSAVGTFAAGLTQTALSMPTNTPTGTPTFTPTTSPTSSTPLATRVIPTVSCYGLVLVTDVTIPDNTPMVPGQTFVKTWRVKNNGTCTWDAGFKFAFTSGNAMGGATLVLGNPVLPGAEMDISIAMTAPVVAGKVAGHWRMSTAAGAFFGDDVFVVIIVGNATATSTNSSTATFTPTPTNIPTITNTPGS